jgi:nucleoside-diphosphate-sugar epimerase
VIDVSGDRAFDRPTEVQIAQTFHVGLGIAREAAKQGNVKAFLRCILPFYDQDTEKKKYKEEDPDGWKPLGPRGVWWHEMLRAVASIPGLPLVALRGAYSYGPGETRHIITKSILLGLVYRSLGEEMKFLYGPKLKRNTVHSRDLVGAAWAACEWAAGLDREKMDALAGVSLPPSGDESVKGVPEAIQKEQGGVIAPVFNIVDDGDLDQAGMADTISKVSICHPFPFLPPSLSLSLSQPDLLLTCLSGLRDQVWFPGHHREYASQVQI